MIVEHLRVSPLRRTGRHQPKSKADVFTLPEPRPNGPYLTGKSFADVSYRRGNIVEIIDEADAKKRQGRKISMVDAHAVADGVTSTVILHVGGAE